MVAMTLTALRKRISPGVLVFWMLFALAAGVHVYVLG